MPKAPKAKRRAGEDARGAARINTADELPNTNSAAWVDKFQGSTSTEEAVGPFQGEASASTPTLADVAADLHRPKAERKGVGHGRGKTPRTICKRLLECHEVAEAEQRRRQEYYRLETDVRFQAREMYIT